MAIKYTVLSYEKRLSTLMYLQVKFEDSIRGLEVVEAADMPVGATLDKEVDSWAQSKISTYEKHWGAYQDLLLLADKDPVVTKDTWITQVAGAALDWNPLSLRAKCRVSYPEEGVDTVGEVTIGDATSYSRDRVKAEVTEWAQNITTSYDSKLAPIIPTREEALTEVVTPTIISKEDTTITLIDKVLDTPLLELRDKLKPVVVEPIEEPIGEVVGPK